MQVEDSPDEPKDLLRTILFLTILDSAIFITPSFSASVRKWMARRRASCLFTLVSSLAVLCSVARWEARVLVSPCTKEMELWQRTHGSQVTTILRRGSDVTEELKAAPSPSDDRHRMRKVKVLQFILVKLVYVVHICTVY